MLRMNQLVGFAAGGAPTVMSSITFFASSDSTADTITAPANIQAGDLILLWDAALAAFAIPAAVTPTGFTNIFSAGVLDGTTGIRGMLSYKIATGSEGGSSITGMDGNTDRKIMAVFRGDIPATMVNVGDPDSNATAGDPAAQTITASGQSVPLIVIGVYRSTSTVDPRSFSPAEDAELAVTGQTTTYMKYKIYNSSPADVTINMDDEGINILGGCYIQMT